MPIDKILENCECTYCTQRRRIAELKTKNAALKAEHAEDQSVIAVWRGRCQRAEAERDALKTLLQEVHLSPPSEWCDECGGEDSMCPGYCIYRRIEATLTAKGE